jgi:hypothetical protein
MESFTNDEKPLRWPVHNTLWHFVRLELDEKEMFKPSRQDVKIPRCTLASVLRASSWPQVTIWNTPLSVVEVVNVTAGKIVTRLALDYEDDPVLRLYDPADLERPDIGELYMRLGSNGSVVAGGGRYAYYVPQPARNPNVKAAFLKKIDLGADPPKVILEGKGREPGLWASVAGASESGGALFVVVKKENSKPPDEPSGRLKVYSTFDLKFQNEVELSISRCDSLEPSQDGKYMYALDRERAKLAVIDVATGRAVKVLDGLAKYPGLVLALP